MSTYYGPDPLDPREIDKEWADNPEWSALFGPGYTDRIRMTEDAWLLAGAQWASKRSTCSRLQVGALLVRDGDILSHGYNGPARGEPHCHHPDDSPCIPSVHAEINALAFAGRRGVVTLGACLYITHAPCYLCAGPLINSGITLVRYAHAYRSNAGLDRLADAGIPTIGP